MTTPAARRRFQFSLRTLMIAVIVYGVLWLVTIKIGGAGLAQDYARRYREIQPGLLMAAEFSTPDAIANHFRAVSNGETLHVEKTQRSGFPLIFTGRAYSPAPFILLWYWDDIEGHPRKPCDVYAWFFGYRRTYREYGPPAIDLHEAIF